MMKERDRSVFGQQSGHVFYSIYLSREGIMFEVTEKAGEMIKEALKDKNPIPSIRVSYNGGG
jgi:hypothetical protein